MKQALLALSASLFACAPLLAAAGDEHPVSRTIEAGGRERTYTLHVPPNLSKPAPLVLVFHGGGGGGGRMGRFTGFDRLSDKEGFLAVYPDGVGGNWNDGRDGTFSEAHRERIDDVGFVGALLDTLSKEFAVDEKRVFATGISNGAFFSHYLAANLARRIAAITPIAGGISDPFHLKFKPEAPVSVLILQGTEDPLVPYHGGGVLRGRRGRLIDTDEAVKLWIAADGCRAEPVRDELPDRDADDGCRAKRATWSGGTDGTEVVLVTLEGGGHTWPNGAQYLPEMAVGRVCRDLDSAFIWEFFKAHPKK